MRDSQTDQRTVPGWLYALLPLAYLALAAAFTYPLFRHLTDFTPIADGSGDEYQTVWFFWWMKKALLGLQNPYWTDMLYFPHGTGLAYHLSPSTDLIAIVFAAVTGSPVNSALVFNMVLLGTSVLIGMASFALIREVTGHPLASFLGSILVTVSPYRLWHLNHLNLLSLGWGILAVYFVLRLLREPRRRHAVAAAISFAVLFYASLSDALNLVIFLVALLCFSWRTIWQHKHRRALLVSSLLGLGVAFLTILPGLYQAWRTGSAWNLTWMDLAKFSADPRDLVLPSDGFSHAAQWLGRSRLSPPGSIPDAFLGWGLLAMVLAVIITLRRRVGYKWFWLAVVFVVLSFGPSLRIGDRLYMENLMPYRWLSALVPYIGLSRTPVRFSVLAQLCLVVFTAQGLAVLCRWAAGRIGTFRRRLFAGTIGSLALVGLIWVEIGANQIELWPMIVQDVYRVIESDTSINALLELPANRPNHLHNRYMYWQTIHGHKIANGYLTHPSPGATDLLERIRSWTDFGDAERHELKAAGINAVVQHDGETSGQGPKVYLLQ